MHKFLNNIIVVAIYCLLIGCLILEMLIIKIPITHSFESSAQKTCNGYIVSLSDSVLLVSEELDTMYISQNRNERVMKVRAEVQGQDIFFENSDAVFAENYNKIYTYEIIIRRISLFECVFKRGGKISE